MYEERFGLSASPFRLNPDPKFFFGSKSHNKAMAYLHYGLRQAEGFIVITGEIGAGKSILIGHLLDQLDRSNIVAANLPTSSLEPSALLAHILSAFRIEPSGTGKSAEIEALEDFLFDQLNRGRRVLLIVDEAQNLPDKTLEELRMLSNMDYDGAPLFQVFLVGQPEFRDTIARPEMEQLRQRVIATYHLNPLDEAETRDYVLHRLAVASYRGEPAIAPDAFSRLFAATGGVPRKINTLCNRLFLYCAMEGVARLDAAAVDAVVADMAEDAANRQDERGKAPQIDAPSAPAAGEKKPALVLTPPPAERAKGAAQAAPAVARSAPPKPAPKPSDDAPMSMFDRLRALRSGVAPIADETEDAPVAATLDDVAKAIAAAETAPKAAPEASLEAAADAALENRASTDAATHTDDSAETSRRDKEEVAASGADADVPPTDDHERPVVADARGWRKAMLASINETRAELKAAHAAVSGLRRQAGEIARRGAERRNRVVAKLDTAETILAEMRNVWR